MKNNTKLLTICQAADILGINLNTINTLHNFGHLPLNTSGIDSWLSNDPVITLREQNRFSRRIRKLYPEALTRLREYDKQFLPSPKYKGYYLHTVVSKKLGEIYYVRYSDKKRVLPTRWSTHTNNFEAATRFAIENKNRLLNEYYQSRANKKFTNSLYKIMNSYYEKGSSYQKSDARRGRKLGDQTRKSYRNSIVNHWLPFLKKQHIHSLNEIDTPLMVAFQDYCMDKNIRPQTVNHYVSFVSHIFDYMVLNGLLQDNPCKKLKPLGVTEDSVKIRNCYNLAEMKGVFNKRWTNEISYLLCMVIYTTGMRNSEMDRMQVNDIIKIGKYRFINIPKSKTRYGARLVPLHDFVYNKLIRYCRSKKKRPEDLVFCQDNGKVMPRQWYTNANIALGEFTKYDKARLKKENITFYSGRHFWKTMVNAGELGEVEEYFMGHKVSNDVAKRYNHRDKQGQQKIVRKARDVFRILDKTLFTQRRSRQRSRS